MTDHDAIECVKAGYLVTPDMQDALSHVVRLAERAEEYRIAANKAECERDKLRAELASVDTARKDAWRDYEKAWAELQACKAERDKFRARVEQAEKDEADATALRADEMNKRLALEKELRVVCEELQAEKITGKSAREMLQRSRDEIKAERDKLRGEQANYQASLGRYQSEVLRFQAELAALKAKTPKYWKVADGCVELAYGVIVPLSAITEVNTYNTREIRIVTQAVVFWQKCMEREIEVAAELLALVKAAKEAKHDAE